MTGVCIMGVEEGLDTGRRLRLPRRCRSGRGRRPARCAPSSSTSGPAARRRARRTAAGADAAGRRADLRRRRSTPDELRLDWADRPSSSTGWCASAGRGRRSVAAASRSTTVELVADAVGRAGSPRRRRGDGRHRRGRAAARSPCSRRASRPMRWRDFANGAHPTPASASAPDAPGHHPSVSGHRGSAAEAPQQTSSQQTLGWGRRPVASRGWATTCCGPRC